MAKMFYSPQEAAAKLGIQVDELKKMVRDGRLREFMDNGPVYRIEDINKMSGGASTPSAGEDVIDLELVEPDKEPGKEDTVITSAGISVFDDEDLEIEADPMAQTQITQSVEDQVTLETTGSGSGLLDLTREADDTSLGAELLDEIYPAGAHAEPADLVPTDAAESTEQPIMMVASQLPERMDPMAFGFAGLALGGILVAAFLGYVVIAMSLGVWPDFLKSLSEGNNPFIFGAAAVVVTVVFGLVGMLIGKGAAGARIH